MASIAAVAAGLGQANAGSFLEGLAAESAIARIAAVGAPAALKSSKIERLQTASHRSPAGVVEILRWFEGMDATHLVWIMSPRVGLAEIGLRRLAQVAADSGAAVLYSDYYDAKAEGGVSLHPLVDYQPGSLRDDFDLGQVVALSREATTGVADAIERDGVSGQFGGWYDLRLRASERGPVVHLSEPTYTLAPMEDAKAGDAHFSYVDPRNRNYQIEMEKVATTHLRRIGAWLPAPATRKLTDGGKFDVEVSVVIPVRNRVKTVADAVKSALSQKPDFEFNVIVVDNHSTDGTTELLVGLSEADSRLVHIVPERADLGIGGCWNEAIYSPRCGRYAVQLDSDDIYSSDDVLSRVVAEFRKGNYAAVIGSYTIVDFSLNEIPPGLIDHREWTSENGHNNALRIHGLGAPRAFHVPTLRTIGFPNVSYGEDYAVALRICREYPVGRIYDSLYWCRRWEGNTDHALPLDTQNRYALYKDRLRSIELAARQQLARQ
jgi:hypothetical protein